LGATSDSAQPEGAGRNAAPDKGHRQASRCISSLFCHPAGVPPLPLPPTPRSPSAQPVHASAAQPEPSTTLCLALASPHLARALVLSVGLFQQRPSSGPSSSVLGLQSRVRVWTGRPTLQLRLSLAIPAAVAICSAGLLELGSTSYIVWYVCASLVLNSVWPGIISPESLYWSQQSGPSSPRGSLLVPHSHTHTPTPTHYYRSGLAQVFSSRVTLPMAHYASPCIPCPALAQASIGAIVLASLCSSLVWHKVPWPEPSQPCAG